jgi:hypothetical protein
MKTWYEAWSPNQYGGWLKLYDQPRETYQFLTEESCRKASEAHREDLRRKRYAPSKYKIVRVEILEEGI